MRLVAKVTSLFSLYRGLPRSIYVLFLATVVNGAGIFVFPFLTLFLTGKLGMDEREAGNFLFFTSIAYLPGAILGGKLADKYGRKIVAVGAQVLAALVYIPCGLLVSSPRASVLIPALVLVNVVFDGFSDPARGAIHTDLTTPENRQAAFSLGYLGHNLGFAIGPLIAGFLFHSAPQWLFWGNALAVAAATSLVALFVPETKPSAEALRASLSSTSSERAHEGNLLSAIRSRSRLVVFVFLGAWYGLVYGQHRFTLPIQTERLFGDAGAALYGSLMSLNAVLVILLTAPTIALMRRFSPAVNVAISGFLFALGFGMLAFVQVPLLFYASTTVWTLGEILNATNADVYIANNTPLSHRGRFNAILPFIGGFGWAIATPLGGSVIHSAGIPVLWLLMFGVATLASVGFLLLARTESP